MYVIMNTGNLIHFTPTPNILLQPINLLRISATNCRRTAVNEQNSGYYNDAAASEGSERPLRGRGALCLQHRILNRENRVQILLLPLRNLSNFVQATLPQFTQLYNEYQAVDICHTSLYKNLNLPLPLHFYVIYSNFAAMLCYFQAEHAQCSPGVTHHVV